MLFLNYMIEKKELILQIFLIAAVLAFGASRSLGQIDTASATGLITDSQGAAIAGARVAITNQRTSIAVETTTNADGGNRPSEKF